MKVLQSIGFVLGLLMLVCSVILIIDKVPGYDQFDTKQVTLYWVVIGMSIAGGIGYMIPLLTSKSDIHAEDITA